MPTLTDGNEAGVLFLPDGTATALVRREGAGAQFGLSTNLTDWTFHDTGVFVGGPDMIQIPDGRIIVGGRFLDNFSTNPRTSLGFLDPVAGTVHEFLTLPSGGDTGYPGFVWHDNKLWVSYYSSHENNKASVYLATVSFDNYTDTFSRGDVLPVTNSLGTTEAGGYSLIERGNTAAQPIPLGTAEIAGGRLRITGSNQGAPTNSNTGGAYLHGLDQTNLRVTVDVGFELASAQPSSISGADSNKFNNTFLLMLRSREGQNFGTNSTLENGLVAIELGPNGDLLIREQTGAGSSGLTTIRSSFNYLTNSAATRQPMPGLLPATYGDGSFDTNQDGYIDGDEMVRVSVELIGTSLRIYLNGAQYGSEFALTNTGAAAGQLNGVGLNKNRLGSSGGFLDQVTSNILLDNLQVEPLYAIPGDFNEDGIVDVRDYVVWRNNIGQLFTVSDYDTWRSHFGSHLANGLSTPAVSEPTSLVLFSFFLVSWCCQDHRAAGR